jgi:hypothetical protein
LNAQAESHIEWVVEDARYKTFRAYEQRDLLTQREQDLLEQWQYDTILVQEKPIDVIGIASSKPAIPPPEPQPAPPPVSMSGGVKHAWETWGLLPIMGVTYQIEVHKVKL